MVALTAESVLGLGQTPDFLSEYERSELNNAMVTVYNASVVFSDQLRVTGITPASQQLSRRLRAARNNPNPYEEEVDVGDIIDPVFNGAQVRCSSDTPVLNAAITFGDQRFDITSDISPEERQALADGQYDQCSPETLLYASIFKMAVAHRVAQDTRQMLAGITLFDAANAMHRFAANQTAALLRQMQNESLAETEGPVYAKEFDGPSFPGGRWIGRNVKRVFRALTIGSFAAGGLLALDRSSNNSVAAAQGVGECQTITIDGDEGDESGSSSNSPVSENPNDPLGLININWDEIAHTVNQIEQGECGYVDVMVLFNEIEYSFIHGPQSPEAQQQRFFEIYAPVLDGITSESSDSEVRAHPQYQGFIARQRAIAAQVQQEQEVQSEDGVQTYRTVIDLNGERVVFGYVAILDESGRDIIAYLDISGNDVQPFDLRVERADGSIELASIGFSREEVPGESEILIPIVTYPDGRKVRLTQPTNGSMSIEGIEADSLTETLVPTAVAPGGPRLIVDSDGTRGNTSHGDTNLNLRNGPGTNTAIVGSLTPGEVIVSTGRADGNWIEIRTEDGQTGWVFDQFVEFVPQESNSQDVFVNFNQMATLTPSLTPTGTSGQSIFIPSATEAPTPHPEAVPMPPAVAEAQQLNPQSWSLESGARAIPPQEIQELIDNSPWADQIGSLPIVFNFSYATAFLENASRSAESFDLEPLTSFGFPEENIDGVERFREYLENVIQRHRYPDSMQAIGPNGEVITIPAVSDGNIPFIVIEAHDRSNLGSENYPEGNRGITAKTDEYGLYYVRHYNPDTNIITVRWYIRHNLDPYSYTLSMTLAMGVEAALTNDNTQLRQSEYANLLGAPLGDYIVDLVVSNSEREFMLNSP